MKTLVFKERFVELSVIFKERFVELSVKDQLATACLMQTDLDNGSASERYTTVNFIAFVAQSEWAKAYAHNSLEKKLTYLQEQHNEKG